MDEDTTQANWYQLEVERHWQESDKRIERMERSLANSSIWQQILKAEAGAANRQQTETQLTGET